MSLESFLRMVMQKVKHDAGELRLYPLRLLCDRLMVEFRNLRDVKLGEEILAIIMILLQEDMNECTRSLQTYVNVLPEHDPLPYAPKLLCP